MQQYPRWKVITILLVVLMGFLYALPNVLPKKFLETSYPSFLPDQTIHLGLDLRGGSHLLVSLRKEELVEPWLKSLRKEVRDRLNECKPGKNKRIAHRSSLRKSDHSLLVRIINPDETGQAMQCLKKLIEPVSNALFATSQNNNLTISSPQNGLVVLTATKAAIQSRLTGAINAAIETIRRRVDALGTTEPIIQRQGADRILVQVPGFDNPAELKRILRKTAKLTFQLVNQTMSAAQARAQGVPVGSVLLPLAEQPGQSILLYDQVIVSGKDLVDAGAAFDQRTNEPIVTFRFNAAGARAFARVTRANVGKPFAIVLNNGLNDKGKPDIKVISAPVIREAILGGTGQISGNFSRAETRELALLLKSGSLPASITIIEERSVGPSLGADSIAAGEMAGIIGIVAVIAFIILAYGSFGIFSTMALVINMVLIIGALSMLQATLTLPGIAGIVLTIGMAVDANVLIFERIREELRSGKTAVSAIETGYNRAFGTILDANITTFIAAFILFWVGTGPVRGFAVTLSIGIITSVFTAFTLTRLMVALWLKYSFKDKGKRVTEVPI